MIPSLPASAEEASAASRTPPPLQSSRGGPRGAAGTDPHRALQVAPSRRKVPPGLGVPLSFPPFKPPLLPDQV